MNPDLSQDSPQPYSTPFLRSPAEQARMGPAPASNGVAIGGMVTGIVGLVFGWVPVFGFVLGALAVILSGVGIHNANLSSGAGRGTAVAGLVCGLLAVPFGLSCCVVIGAANSVTAGTAG